jgi:Na+/H+-dicarboxylate symporter
MAILLGLALVQVKDQAHITASSFFSAVYEMFISILDWILYLLPLGLFCLLADQASEVGVDALRVMLSIVVVYLVCFGIMAALYLAQIRRATGKSVPEIWRIFKEPFTLAFVASSDSALPSILTIWPLFEWFPELQCAMASCANTAIAGNIPTEGPACRAS